MVIGLKHLIIEMQQDDGKLCLITKHENNPQLCRCEKYLKST